MKTLRELLKESGQTDDQINATLVTLGPAQGLFETALQAADRANTDAAAKLAEAQGKETKLNTFWNDTATPQINEAFSKAAAAEAEVARYKTMVEAAKKYGFINDDAAGGGGEDHANAGGGNGGGRGGDGKFLPNPVPGSPGQPVYLTEEQGVAAITEAAYLMSEHQRLFGEPLPDLGELVKQAGQTKRKARDIWGEKYGVEKKRQEIATAAKAAERAAIATEERAKIAKEYADKYGNEGTRPMVPSRFPSYAKDPATGAPDKLAWTKPDKREKLRQRIHEQVAKETGSVQ
jgi:hypothetical protein